MKNLSLKICLFIGVIILNPSISMATSPCSSTEQDEPVETSDNVIAEFQAWSVFIETGPEQCFVGADPLETIIEPALAEESLCRGAMGLTVGYWPETGVHGQLSFRSGYEFDPDTDIEFIVDDTSYPLSAEKGGKIAWPGNADEDLKLISAMKQGSRVEIIAKAASGANVKDTYLLSGFASAVDLAAETCSYMLAELN